MTWRDIEAAAREQALAVLDAREQTPLEYGEHIAWAEQRFGRTDGLSDIHRVGLPKSGDPYTTCGVSIPAPVQWMTLSPALVRTMPRCRFCEAEYFRQLEQQAQTQITEHAA